MAGYEIDQYAFASKAQAKRYLSSALDRHSDGERVTDVKLAGILTALAGLHHDPAEKVGQGILYWVAMPNNDLGYYGRGFRNVQVGRAEPVDFGYRKVIDPPSQVARVAEALTQEALEVTRKFRRDAFVAGSVSCVLTGQPLNEITDARAIHLNPTRGTLHRLFLDSQGLDYDAIVLVKPEPKSPFLLADRELAGRWIAFQTERLNGMAIAKIQRHQDPTENS